MSCIEIFMLTFLWKKECWVGSFCCLGWQRCVAGSILLFFFLLLKYKERYTINVQLQVFFSLLCSMWSMWGMWGKKTLQVWALASWKSDLLFWAVLLRDTLIWTQMSGTLSCNMEQDIGCFYTLIFEIAFLIQEYQHVATNVWGLPQITDLASSCVIFIYCRRY